MRGIAGPGGDGALENFFADGIDGGKAGGCKSEAGFDGGPVETGRWDG